MKNLKLGCILAEKNGVLRDRIVPTIFYINCKNEAIIIQISVFTKEVNFTGLAMINLKMIKQDTLEILQEP